MAAPIRLSLLFPKNLPPLRNQKLLHTQPAVKEPAYPPIVCSLAAKSKSARKRQIAEQVTRICGSPLEEKISLITHIQRKKFVVYPQTFSRDADRWYQHFTKTAYIPGLPEKFSLGQEEEEEEGSPAAAASVPGIEEDAFRDICSLVSRAILQDHWQIRKRKPFLYREQELVVGPPLRNLVSGLTHSLARYNPLLLHSSLDRNAEVNFYWRRGQRIIPKGHRKGRPEPTRFQIDDKPHSQIRITQQLPQFTPIETSYTAEVPEITLAPNTMPLFRRQYDNQIFTGAVLGWLVNYLTSFSSFLEKRSAVGAVTTPRCLANHPETAYEKLTTISCDASDEGSRKYLKLVKQISDPACYGHTQFHLVPDRYHRNRMIRQQQLDQVEVFLRANGLASLFAWTGAQAMYQGFWNHEDVTRPFVSQAVITDGQFFSFFCYQLNTVALSVETDANNPRKNLLWGTESLRLYDSVQDGEVIGLNQDVIKLLIRFLMNQP